MSFLLKSCDSVFHRHFKLFPLNRKDKNQHQKANHPKVTCVSFLKKKISLDQLKKETSPLLTKSHGDSQQASGTGSNAVVTQGRNIPSNLGQHFDLYKPAFFC